MVLQKKFRAVLLSVCGLALSLCVRSPQAWSQASNTWTPIGPHGGSVFSLQVDPFNDNVLYVGTFFGGLYKSVNAGGSWKPLTLPTVPPSAYTVRAIAIDPQRPGILYAGVGLSSTFESFTPINAGVYKSTNGGQTWKKQNTGLTDKIVQELAVDPFNSQILLAATPSGLFRSTNAAASWNKINGSLTNRPGKIFTFDPNQPGIVYLGLSDEPGALRSTNGGATWQIFNKGLGGNIVNSMSFDRRTNIIYLAGGTGSVFKLMPGTDVWVNISNNLPFTFHVLPDPSESQRLFAATLEGIFRSVDSGQSWHPSSPDISPSIFAAGRAGSVIYAGTPDPNLGVVSSRDGGDTWVPRKRGLQNFFIGRVATAPRIGGSAIYAATTGIHYKHSAALSWRSSFTDGTINDICVHPKDARVLFIGLLKDGLWKSSDYARTWRQTSNGIVPPQIHAIVQSPLEPYLLYAGTSNGYYVSKDHGSSWSTPYVAELLGIPDIFSVAVALSDARTAYFGSVGVVYKATGGGDSGEDPIALPGVGLPQENIIALLQTITGKLYAISGGTGQLFASFDDGVSWSLASTEIPDKVLSIVVDTWQPEIVYLGTTGGIYKSEDEGRTWMVKNSGLIIKTVSSLLIDPNDPQTLYAGAVGHVYKSTNGANSWSEASGGLPSLGEVNQLVIHPFDRQVLYASMDEGDIFRSDNGGGHWNATRPFQKKGVIPIALNVRDPTLLYAGTSRRGLYASKDEGMSWHSSSKGMSLWVRRIAIHPLTPTTMYAAALFGGLFKSSNGGVSWFNMGLTDTYLLDVVVHPVNPNMVYAATSNGVQLSLNGGATWIDVGPQASISALAVNPKDPGIIYAGAEKGGGIFKSVDGGESWRQMSNGIDGRHIFTLAVDPVQPETVYAGSASKGVFVTENGGGLWTPLRKGLFNQFVLTLAIDQSNHKIVYAGTEGGGVFKLVRP